MGQARRLRRVHDESGLPPAPERLRHYSEPTLRARKRHDQRYGRGYGRGMKLVFIHGAPAAGKLTTARALLALVNGRLCSVMKLRAPCSEAIFFLAIRSALPTRRTATRYLTDTIGRCRCCPDRLAQRLSPRFLSMRSRRHHVVKPKILRAKISIVRSVKSMS